MANNEGNKSVFAQYIDNPQKERHDEPEIVRRGPQPIIPPAHYKSSPSEKLLAWIINFWPQPVISLRDIQIYGPNCIRDAHGAMSVAKTLTEYGWLAPIKAHRRDRKLWRVIREPSRSLPQG
jgi:hypothetical protein